MREVDAAQAEVRLITELPAGGPAEDAALELLAHIAGGTKSSRLERALDAEPKLARNLEGFLCNSFSRKLCVSKHCPGSRQRENTSGSYCKQSVIRLYHISGTREQIGGYPVGCQQKSLEVAQYTIGTPLLG